MPLHGSSIPLDGGQFVVTIICPNEYARQRLMQAMNNIVPEAGEPTPQPVRAAKPARDPEQEDDTGEPYPIPNCATGACGVE